MYIPLVLPVLLIVSRRNCGLLFYIIDTEPEDDPCKHDGRIRSFSHFPGNCRWAMHVYIRCEYVTVPVTSNTIFVDAFHLFPVDYTTCHNIVENQVLICMVDTS